MLYRSRLGNDLNKITLDYVSSISDDSEIAFYDIIGSQAHTVMLYESKLISKNDSKKILCALEGLKKEKFDQNYTAEDIHELIESLVIKKAGPASGGKMHTARSRNDQVALDIRMKIRDDIIILCNCILDTTEALISLADKHKKTVMPLYTHLQQAQAGTFSHYLLAHCDVLLRDLERLSDAFRRVNQSPLGAGPVGGTSLPIDRNLTSELLGFSGLVENSIDATSTRDFVAEYLSDVAILMTNLSKLAEDFVIWSSAEFSFIELSDEFTSPSSVMPQKKNPDILELTRGKASQMIGNLVGVLATIKGLATGYGRDLQEIKSSIWSASKTSISALIVIKSMLLTLSVNEKNMKKTAQASYLVALDVAEKLVRQGTPFRTAHKISGKLVQSAYNSKKPLNKLSQSEIRKAVGDDISELANIIASATISDSLRERISRGSSGFSEQKRMINHRKTVINDWRIKITHSDNEISNSLEDLSNRVRDLTKTS